MVKNASLAYRAAGLSLILALGPAACSEAKNAPFQGIAEFEEIALAFEFSGLITHVNVQRGDWVQLGATLAHLDDAQARTTYEARQSELTAAQAALALLEAGSRKEDIRAVDAELVGARAVEAEAQRNLQRQEILQAQKVISQSTLDEARATLATARSTRQAKEQQALAVTRGPRREDIDAARANVETAQAAVALAQETLERHVLTAPIAGRILDKLREPGEVANPGLPVVLLANPQEPYVEVFVPQAEVAKINVGEKALVRTDGMQQALVGLVETIARTTEFTPRYLFSEGERQNLVVRVRVRVDDPQEQLRAGIPTFVTFGAIP